MIHLTKSEFDNMRDRILTNPNILVRTENKSFPKKFKHIHKIISKFGELTLEINNSTTTYYLK